MEPWKAILTSAAISAFVALLTGFSIYFLSKRDRKSEAKSKKDKWVGSVDSDRNNFKEFIRDIREDIREIRQDIKSIFRGVGTQTVSTKSPLELTDIGRKISVEIGAREWAQEEAGRLFSRVQGMSEYQTQEFCMRYCVYQFRPDQEYLLRLEQSAFTNGLDLRSVREVLGVVLRDQILKVRGEIPK